MSTLLTWVVLFSLIISCMAAGLLSFQLNNHEIDWWGTCEPPPANTFGWRQSQEDAHVINLGRPNSPSLIGMSAANGQNTKVEADGNTEKMGSGFFAVFDGHAGKEVAKFCQVHMLDELELLLAEGMKAPQALRKVFHRMDDLLCEDGALEELEGYVNDTAKEPYSSGKRCLSEPVTPAEPEEDCKKKHSFSTRKAEEQSTEQLGSRNDESNNSSTLDTSAVKNKQGRSESLLSDIQIHEHTQYSADVINGPVVSEIPAEETVGTTVSGGENIVAADTTLELFKTLAEVRWNSGEAGVGGRRGGMEDNPIVSSSIRAEQQRSSLMLPDHRVRAGCTSVVACVLGRKLYVANAGDSRAVMCRNGEALQLSEDHKPFQEKEWERIKSAGGYVTAAGRVNGNLNLSRSIGDLKYKQVPSLPPEFQIITAEPDIFELDLEPEIDEFFILACDGVWDVMSSQEVVGFMKNKLNEGISPNIAVEALFDACICDDPHNAAGQGADNMTCVFVSL